jgi:uncharacterized damage-inducible protein DinB
MQTQLSEVVTRLDLARAALRAAVDAVPAHLRGQRPGPDRWSVSEVLEHLSLVEKRFTAIIAMRIGEARQAGLGPEQHAREPLPPNLQQLMGDRANRRTAPEAVQPKGNLDDAAAWAEVERARADLLATVTAADGLALSHVVHNHPVFGPLNVYQLIEFVAAHEARHCKQIAGVAEAL